MTLGDYRYLLRRRKSIVIVSVVLAPIFGGVPAQWLVRELTELSASIPSPGGVA
jgi:hypothetical protein